MALKYSADDSDWRVVEELLPPRYEAMAEDHRFVTADERGDEKDVSVAIKLRMMLCLAANSLSLRTTVALFAAANVVTVSHVALHHWFKKAGRFLSAVLAALIQSNQTFAPERWAGYRVRAMDATTVEKPGAKGTTARIHYMLELNSMLVPEVIVTDEKTGESFRNFKIETGSLNLGDRGYSNPPSIAAVAANQADVLVRWNRASTPLLYVADGRAVNAYRLARTIQEEGQPRELPVLVVRRERSLVPIRCRLIVTKLPAAQAAEARSRLRKGSDPAPTRENLFLAGFVFLLTTVPDERMTAGLLAELYRLRWQIELEFKREKSIGELDRLPNFLPETIRSWILAKLISAELSRRLFFRPECDPPGGPPAVVPDSHDSDTGTADLAGPLHAHAPWEMKSLGQQVLRRCLLALPIGCESLREFGRRFVRHLNKLKATGSRQRRQIRDFLELLKAHQEAATA